MTGPFRPVRPGEIAALAAWAPRISAAGPGDASPAGTAATRAAAQQEMEES